MICCRCQEAGAQNATGDPARAELAKTWHEACRGGTWCDCQHRTGPGFIKDPGKED